MKESDTTKGLRQIVRVPLPESLVTIFTALTISMALTSFMILGAFVYYRWYPLYGDNGVGSEREITGSPKPQAALGETAFDDLFNRVPTLDIHFISSGLTHLRNGFANGSEQNQPERLDTYEIANERREAQLLINSEVGHTNQSFDIARGQITPGTRITEACAARIARLRDVVKKVGVPTTSLSVESVRISTLSGEKVSRLTVVLPEQLTMEQLIQAIRSSFKDDLTEVETLVISESRTLIRLSTEGIICIELLCVKPAQKETRYTARATHSSRPMPPTGFQAKPEALANPNSVISSPSPDGVSDQPFNVSEAKTLLTDQKSSIGTAPAVIPHEDTSLIKATEKESLEPNDSSERVLQHEATQLAAISRESAKEIGNQLVLDDDHDLSSPQSVDTKNNESDELSRSSLQLDNAIDETYLLNRTASEKEVNKSPGEAGDTTDTSSNSAQYDPVPSQQFVETENALPNGNTHRETNVSSVDNVPEVEAADKNGEENSVSEEDSSQTTDAPNLKIHLAQRFFDEPEQVDEDLEIPEDSEEPRYYLAIILDDGGYGGSETERILELDNRLTLAILPDTPYARETAEAAAARDFEVIVHMPMQAGNGSKNHFPGELRVNMTKEKIQERTREFLRQFPEAVGVNNHTGGLFTTHAEKVGWFLEIVKEENMYFVDSRTIGNSRAYDVAVEMDIPCARRDVFLDHSNNIDDIRRRFKELVDLTKKQGWAIGIGHFRPNTIKVLEEELPKLENMGIILTPVSELVW